MDYVSLKELAQELDLDRSNLRKYALKKGFDLIRVRTPDSRGQPTLALSAADAESLREARESDGYNHQFPIENGNGFFYVIRLVPEFAPNRMKLGFASNVNARLQAHRTAAPTAQLVKAWPCQKSWEVAAIASLTRQDCQLVANEVFDCNDVNELVTRGDGFFAIMPSR